MATFFVLLSLFLLFAFISFFFYWKEDFNIANNFSPLNILKGNNDISNWGGPVGAILSHYLISRTFGLASFGYIIVFAFIGLYLYGIKIKNVGKIILYTFIIMLYTSFLIGFITDFSQIKAYNYLSGVVGFAINNWLNAVMGKVGAALILVFLTITLPMFLFKVRYSFVKKLFIKREKNKENIEENQTKKEETPIEDMALENDLPEDNSPAFDPEPIDITKGYNREEDVLSDDDRRKLTAFEIKTSSSFSKSLDKEEENSNQSRDNEKEDVEFEISNHKNEEGIVEDEDSAFEQEGDSSLERRGINTQYDPKEDLSSFSFPSIDSLINYEERNEEVKPEELIANKERIITTLKNYNIDISKIVATPGPTVTLYEIVPAPGIRISKIKNLEDDIALSLAALGIRIIAPIPGKGTIGIEVPNQHPQIVSMRSMLISPEFKESKFSLPIAIGKTISNRPFVADLAKMPHLLMAGATGQGKSVGLNAIISSLLYKKHPSELKFVMVDPKKVELSLYAKIERHYLAKLPDSEEAIITDTRKVVRTLNSLCIEMDNRYDLLKDAQVKNIKEYNAKFCIRRLNPEDGHRYLPYIVLVIDEFADLIMTAGKEVEMPIARLAQLARAVGIHLIIATQRPSVNIITGTIKANFPARIAFRVTSKIDSRTILDTSGAEQLIGRGDMLLSTGNDIIRLQCALIDTEEIEEVADYIGNQRGYPQTFLLPEYIDENAEPNKEFDPKQIDDKFEEAARIIVSMQHGSTSIIQRKLSLGYNRAGRIIDQLEAAGIVGPFEGSKAREVRVRTEEELNEILREYLGK
jgi:S-DNA-T family DNA segregation ATPase FtsK/SpoIIIE